MAELNFFFVNRLTSFSVFLFTKLFFILCKETVSKKRPFSLHTLWDVIILLFDDVNGDNAFTCVYLMPCSNNFRQFCSFTLSPFSLTSAIFNLKKKGYWIFQEFLPLLLRQYQSIWSYLEWGIKSLNTLRSLREIFCDFSFISLNWLKKLKIPKKDRKALRKFFNWS